MAFTINLYYTGTDGNAWKFAEEMRSSGLVDQIRAEQGNLRYEYFLPMDDPETVLFIDAWESEEALDLHHKSPMMKEIAALREKYHLKLQVQKFQEINERRTHS